jgi:hypothetical protein
MRRRKGVVVKEGRCPICGKKGFPYPKPVKAKGRSYTYLYYGHYSREKYRRRGLRRSHVKWCYIGRYVKQKEGSTKMPPKPKQADKITPLSGC